MTSNGERKSNAPPDPASDDWFDLLDDAAQDDLAQRPSRPGPFNLQGLNAISNKITPVMLAPVHHLLPIDPAPAASFDDDAWGSDAGGESFFSAPPANGDTSQAVTAIPAAAPSEAPAADDHGEFLDFAEAPSHRQSQDLIRRHAASPPPEPVRPSIPDDDPAAEDPTPVVPYGIASEDPTPVPAPMPVASEKPTPVPLAGRSSHMRRSRPPTSMPAPARPPSSPPRTATLMGQLPKISVPPPPPSTPPAALEDNFDLSDFDRWGEGQLPGPSSSVASAFTDGAEFTTPPQRDDFSEALTIPRLGPAVPAVSPVAPSPPAAPPPVAVASPAVARPATSTVAWSASEPAATPARPPPPLPRTQPAAPQPRTQPVAPQQTQGPSTPRVATKQSPPGPVRRPTPEPVRVRRVSPHQEMHERLDLGDFTGALAAAETMLEVDPDDHDATHVAEVCRAKLKAIYIGRLGSLDFVPVLAVAPAEMRRLSLDHRAGFLLSLVDGVSSLEELIDLAAMPPLEALRTFYNLTTQQVITLRRR